MKSTIRTGLFLFATAILGAPAGALAQEKPCMNDAAKLCPGIEPGSGALAQCLKAHKDALSPACKKKMMSMKMKHDEMQQDQQQQQNTPNPTPPQPTP